MPGTIKHDSRSSTGTLFVCGYPNLWDHIAAVRPHRIISILGPNDHAEWPSVTGVDHLRLEIDDVQRPCNGFVHATEAHIRQLLTFLREWTLPDRLLIHCWAGSSRSTAAALVAIAVRHPGRELEAATMLRATAPQARPNELMCRLADRVLGLEGQLVRAVEAMPVPRGAAGTDLIRIRNLGG